MKKNNHELKAHTQKKRCGNSSGGERKNKNKRKRKKTRCLHKD